jgi:hypothetical protein
VKDYIKTIGQISLIIKQGGQKSQFSFQNQLLNGGRRFLISNLLQRPSSTSIFLKNMLFGDGGAVNDDVKPVVPEMEQMFGVTRMKKEAVVQINPEIPTQLLLTVIVPENEGNDFALNEMALELSDGTLFSLATFPSFNKTDQMELTWLWSVFFV